jgi:acyl-coenzyme A thioesterase PaaI-like protein
MALLHHTGAHHPRCFACGIENPCSPAFRFEQVGDDRIIATCRFDDRHQGSPGVAHGGAVATAIDDTLGTLVFVLDQPAVTARLELDYRRQAKLGRDLSIEAWAEARDGRKLHLAAEMREGDDVIAEARGLFVAVDVEDFFPPEIREHWVRDRDATP